MTRKTINGSPGLYTAANAEILPPGALLAAKGVVIRRPGLIQKARPFRQYSYGGDSGLAPNFPYSLGFFSGRLYMTIGGCELWAETAAASGVFADTGYAACSGASFAEFRAAEANNNWYLRGYLKTSGGTTLGSTGKIDAAGGTPYAAGCPRALDPIMSLLSTGTLFSAGQSRAYRAVLTFRDANNNLIFGAPSGPVTLLATGAQDAQARVLLPADVYNAANATSYRVQLYASNVVASGSNPDDEMQLVADYNITAADVANKYVTITDNTPDTLKGILGSGYLYTNPSQQTLAAANYTPPIANDLAHFKGSLWMANTTQKHRASLTMIAPPEFWAIQSIAANTPGAGQSTYTFLAAVDLTGIDNTMKLAVTGSTAGSNDGTWAVVSINNGTHTVVVTNAGVAQAGVAGTAISGKLTIGNTSYFPIFGTSSVANHYYTVPSTGTSQAKVSAATISLVGIINQTTTSNVVAYNVTNPLSPAGEMQLEEASIGGSAFTATALGTTTAGYRGAFSITFAPAIPTATPLTSLNDNRKNRLHFSKTGQPEHFPLSDSFYFDIGSASKAILRIIPLRNALLVFKEDGLFKVTGDAGVFSWAPFDPTQFILDERLVATMYNTAIALTTRGVWQFTETSSRYLSGPVEDKINQLTSSASTVQKNIRLSLTAPPCMSVNESDGLVFLYATLKATTSSPSGVALTYSLSTGAWSESFTGSGNGTGSTDGVTGQVDFAALSFISVNGTRFGVARQNKVTTDAEYKKCDIYMEDQYAAVYSSTTFNQIDGLAAGGEPTTGHKYIIDVTATDSIAKTITATSRGGPAYAVGDLIAVDATSLSGTTYRVTTVNGTTLTLAAFSGTDHFAADFSVARFWRSVAQPVQVDYQPFTNGEDGLMKEFTEVLAIMDPASTTTAASVSIGCYGENFASASMTVAADARNTATNPMLYRIGVEGAAQVARRLAVRITHSNPLEYFYLRGVSYLFNEQPDSIAIN